MKKQLLTGAPCWTQGAAVREVLEETGVQTRFCSLAAFRETHAGPFGCTDLCEAVPPASYRRHRPRLWLRTVAPHCPVRGWRPRVASYLPRLPPNPPTFYHRAAPAASWRA